MTVTPLGSNTGDSGGVTVSITGTDTKSSYVEVIASTAEDYEGFFVKASRLSTITEVALDIALGASSSEVDLVNDLLLSGMRADAVPLVFVPLPIPSGSRVSVRGASSRTSTDVEVSIVGVASSSIENACLTGTTGVDTHGFNSGDTGGVQIDPGGTANTKNGYVEVVAATSNAAKYLGMAIAGQENFTLSDAENLIDIAIGAGGAETNIIENIQVSTRADFDGRQPSWFLFPIEIASGSRLSVQAQSSEIDATDRVFDVVLYVFYGTLPTVGGGGTSMHPNKRGGKQ